jgi:hypothetical protein
MSNGKIHFLALSMLLCASHCAHAQKEPPLETLEVKEVSERAMTLDQSTFRLKFFYRQNINQIDADHYWVRVFDLDYNHVCVTFPKEALSFFKKVVTQEDSYKKFKNSPYYGTSSGSASGIYVTAHAITEASKPGWWQNYTYNSHPTPMLVLDAIGKGASKNISGETKFKW